MAPRRSYPVVFISLMAIMSAACLCGGGAWLFTPGYASATLVKVPLVGTSTGYCLSGDRPTSGVTLNLQREFVSPDDLVTVLGWYTKQHWGISSLSLAEVILLPLDPPEIHLLFLQTALRQSVVLSYTPERSTRIVLSSSLVLCPP